MSEEKSIRIIEFSGKKSDYDGWREKFLAKAEYKGYRKLLLCKKDKVGYDRIPTEEEYDEAMDKSTKDANDKKIIELAKLNRLAYMDMILSIDHKSSRGKVAFRLVKNSKSSEYPEGNCKLAWDRLVAKYAPRSTPSLLKLKKQFENSKLESVETDPEDWVSELEGLRTEIECIDSTSAMSEKDFMVKILNNLPSEYDVILDGLENRLTLDDADNDKLTVEDIREKLNMRYERIKQHEKYEMENEHEKALKASVYFKGTCHNCGKYGHKSAFCPDKDGDGEKKGNGRLNGTCHYCGKRGHHQRECRLYKKHRAEIDEQAKFARIEEEEESSDDESIDELGF